MLDGRGDRRVLVRWVAAAAVCVLVSAATATSAAASEQPLSIDISDGSFPTIRVNGSFSYYLVSGNDRIALVGPAGTPDDVPQTLDLTAPDGRSACASITDGPEGTILLTLRIEDKGEFEKLGISLRVTETEGFYGLMERVVQGSQALSWSPGIEEGLNLRGQTVDLYMLPTVSIYAPFFLSSRGYGVFVDSDWPGTYRFGVDAEGRKAPTEVTIEQEGPELKLLLLPGPTPTDVVERYARLTGEPLLPPRFIFGPGRWRDEVWDLPTFYDGTPYDGPYNSMIVEDVLMMDALGIPCSFIVVDRPWAAGTFGYGDMRLDDARLPGFSNMVAWLDGRGIETLLWLGPWVMDGQRSVAISRGFHVPLTLPYLPNAALIDFTNGDGLAWWIAELEPLFETGISGFKLDRGEEKPPDGQLFRGAYADGTNYRQGHNAYPLWFALAAEAAAIAAGVEDFALFYRAAWTGSSAHAVAWGGDTAPTSWGLRSALIGLQRAAVLNVPVWGSDTGGYNARPPREVLARWLAFSAFCPIMEVGPTANLAPWSWLDDASKDEISAAGYTFDTTYDVELLAIWSMYARIHDALGELLYALAEDAHERGTPIVRPMILAYPEDSRFVDTFEQYLLGPDLLVRPVWEEGADDVEVLLPEGTWIDAWSNRAYTGPTSILVETPLHVIPLFVRYGADVPLADLDLSWQNALARVRQRPDLGKSVTQVD